MSARLDTRTAPCRFEVRDTGERWICTPAGDEVLFITLVSQSDDPTWTVENAAGRTWTIRAPTAQAAHAILDKGWALSPDEKDGITTRAATRRNGTHER